jgi:hypothetical protein
MTHLGGIDPKVCRITLERRDFGYARTAASSRQCSIVVGTNKICRNALLLETQAFNSPTLIRSYGVGVRNP